MNGRVWPLTAAFLAGILFFVGPAWVGVILVSWTLYKTRRLLGWWLLVALVGGALVGYHEQQLQKTPPLPKVKFS